MLVFRDIVLDIFFVQPADAACQTFKTAAAMSAHLHQRVFYSVCERFAYSVELVLS